MSLPNPTMSFSPFAILTAEELNDMNENIQALAAGTGLNDGAIAEIKTVVKSSYTTTEVNTGTTWIDGKTIYKKTINFGSLPNNTSKSVAHGITGLTRFVEVYGVSTDGTNHFPLPYPVLIDNNLYGVQLSVEGANIVVRTGANRSTHTAFVTLTYIK